MPLLQETKIIIDALHAASIESIDTLSPSEVAYARGMLVGIVTGVIAMEGCTFQGVWEEILDLGVNIAPECIPEGWPKGTRRREGQEEGIRVISKADRDEPRQAPVGPESAEMIAAPVEESREDRPSNYPQFRRENGYLVKFGWSRTRRREYRHAIPRTAVDKLIAILVEWTSDGDPIHTKSLLSLLDSGEQRICHYYVYDSMLWLKTIGLVRKHGHRGYTVNGTDIEKKVEMHWQDMPESTISTPP